jgi:hypothetical protein
MNEPQPSADSRQSPLLTIAACVFVLLLAYMFSCVNDIEGIISGRTNQRMAPASQAASNLEERAQRPRVDSNAASQNLTAAQLAEN